jgi:DNA-binding response OmpR family regulator
MMTSIAPSLRGRRVFIAEDETLIAFDIASCLEFEGYEVVGPFVDLAEALSALDTSSIDVALLDVNLRGAAVWPVAARLRAQGVPFAFLTGYASLDEFPSAFADVPRLDKPFVPEKLFAVLAALDNTGPVGPAEVKLFDSDLRAVQPVLAGAT